MKVVNDKEEGPTDGRRTNRTQTFTSSVQDLFNLLNRIQYISN